MNLQRPNLTKGQLAFAEAFLRLRNREAAEKEAGLTPGYGYKLLLRPDVQAEIRAREEATLVAEGLPEAVQGLIDIVKSSKAPASARVAAAKVIIDRALGSAGESQTKDVHEMTPEELAQAISTLEAQAAKLATPVNVPSPFE